MREAEKSAAVSQEAPGTKELEGDPVIVFSAVADKKYEEIQDLCTQIPARCYVVTEIEDKRRVPAEELKAVFERYTDKVLERKELKDAFSALRSRTGAKRGRFIVLVVVVPGGNGKKVTGRRR